MKPSIETLIRRYLRELHIQNRTTKDAQYALRKYTRYLTDTGSDAVYMSIHDAQEFHNSLTTVKQENGSLYSSSNIGVVMSYVSSFYDFLQRNNLVMTNPFRAVKRIKHEKRLTRNVLKEDEMRQVLSYFRSFTDTELSTREKVRRYKAHVVAELMYAIGARISEITALRQEDINFLRGTIVLHEQKTGQVRECILNSYSREVLQVYVDTMRDHVTTPAHGMNSSLLFGATDSLRRLINSMLQEACAHLKLTRVTSHVFRHGVGSHFLKRGCDIRYIQEILGHRALSSTQVYTHIDKEDLRAVIDRCHPRGGTQ
jgi:site-specific recombinase XerD